VRLRRDPERVVERRVKARPSATGLAAADLDGEAAARFEALRAWRATAARAQGVPGYVVFHDATLRAMAELAPRDLDALATVSGVGAAKLARYGAQVLAVLAGSTAEDAVPAARASCCDRTDEAQDGASPPTGSIVAVPAARRALLARYIAASAADSSACASRPSSGALATPSEASIRMVAAWTSWSGCERVLQARDDRASRAPVEPHERDGELVAAHATEGVAVAQDAAQAVGGLDQHGVAGGVAVEVVDVLEAVDVEEGQGDAGVRFGEGLGQERVEGAPVQRARQRVAVGLVAQALLPGALDARTSRRITVRPRCWPRRPSSVSMSRPSRPARLRAARRVVVPGRPVGEGVADGGRAPGCGGRRSPDGCAAEMRGRPRRRGVVAGPDRVGEPALERRVDVDDRVAGVEQHHRVAHEAEDAGAADRPAERAVEQVAQPRAGSTASRRHPPVSGTVRQRAPAREAARASFCRYMRASARVTSASSVSPSRGALARPMLAPTCTMTPSAVDRALDGGQHALAGVGEPDGVMPGSSTAYSSPPKRATVSPSRTSAFSRTGDLDQDASPAACP
jgi:hypothetical protein